MKSDEGKPIRVQVAPLEQEVDESDQTILANDAISAYGENLADLELEPETSGPTLPPIDGGIVGLGGGDDDDEEEDDDVGREVSFDGFDTSQDDQSESEIVGVESGNSTESPSPMTHSELVGSVLIACMMVGIVSIIYGFGVLVNRTL